MATVLWPLATSPYAKIEKGAGCSASHSASAADIFIGCCSYITLPRVSALTTVRIVPTSAVTRPSRSDIRIVRMCCFLRRWKMAMPVMKAPPTRMEALMTCQKLTSAVSWKSTCGKSVSSARVLPSAFFTIR